MIYHGFESVKNQLQHTKGNHPPFPKLPIRCHPFDSCRKLGSDRLVNPGIPRRIVVVAAFSIVIMMFADIFEVATFRAQKSLFLQTSQAFSPFSPFSPSRNIKEYIYIHLFIYIYMIYIYIYILYVYRFVDLAFPRALQKKHRTDHGGGQLTLPLAGGELQETHLPS